MNYEEWGYADRSRRRMRQIHFVEARMVGVRERYELWAMLGWTAAMMTIIVVFLTVGEGSLLASIAVLALMILSLPVYSLVVKKLVERRVESLLIRAERETE
jgi:hypothetical protein